jgi:hypothetical protein
MEKPVGACTIGIHGALWRRSRTRTRVHPGGWMVERLLILSRGELSEMAKFISARRLSGIRQARRQNAISRARGQAIVRAQHRQKKLIPDGVLKSFQEMQLQPETEAYTQALNLLLSEDALT